ncbi:MAG: transporter substrate-binding domain-containing protein [Anaerolineae bacterium]|nr:transporter substrate-binding domain-containing protein [Anaerolineae bacterium]
MNRRPKILIAPIAAALLWAFLCVSVLSAQDAPPHAPTLIPPTLVPMVETALVDALPTESGIARIVASNAVRIGILFNEIPFGELNVRGEISGFDADLGRAVAEAWGITPEFVQVTRQTGPDMLEAGQIDLLIAAQPHLRSLDSLIEFSEAYYPSEQVMVLRDGDPVQALSEMSSKRIGYIMGTRSEMALQEWANRTGITVTTQPYVNLDQALSGLTTGDVDGLVANRLHIQRAVTQPGVVRVLGEPVMPEPYAIGIRRMDTNLREMVDRTLQYLAQSGRLNEIHRANFNNVDYPAAMIVPWANIGDSAPTPAQFGTDIPMPAQYVIPRMQNDRTLRVAGIRDVPPDAPESVRRLDTAHRAFINEIARRWNVTVVYVPDNGANPLDLLASGQADLVIGVEPDWNTAGQAVFSEPYLMHGFQLLTETSANITGLGDLRGKGVGIFADESDARAILTERAEAARAIVDDVYQLANESDAAFAILVGTDLNLTAVFGDSMRLLPHLQANPDTLELLSDSEGNPIFFSRHYLALATPRADLDFELLVDYTLQEMMRDGTLASVLAPVTTAQGIPPMEIWPGATDFLGFAVTG